MDVLFDAQPLQSGSRLRGIGRYTRNLLRGLREARPGWRVRLVQNARFRPLDPADAGGLPVVTFRPPLATSPPHLPDIRVNARYYADWLAAHRPDVILVPSVFEHETIVPEFGPDRPRVFTVLYDFIPLLFADHLLSGAEARAWYGWQVGRLLDADGVLSISEASTRDLHRLFPGLAGAVTTIGGAPDPCFAPLPADELAAQRERLRGRLDLGREFVLCVASGPEVHKNSDGALRAFAALPPRIRATLDLVIAGRLRADHNAGLARLGRDLGIGDALRLPGSVSDAELRALYQTCRVFLCPSLYEGLGLPVLEALRCGAPVVASDRASVPEVAGPVSRLADPTSAADMAAAIEATLAEPRDAGLVRRQAFARQFTWRRTAELACRAVESAPATRRLRVAWVAPAARGDGSSGPGADPAVLTALGAHLDLELVVDRWQPAVAAGLARLFRVVASEEVAARHAERPYDLFVHHLADHPDHAHAPLLNRFGWLVVLDPSVLDAPGGGARASLGRADAIVTASSSDWRRARQAVGAPVTVVPPAAESSAAASFPDLLDRPEAGPRAREAARAYSAEPLTPAAVAARYAAVIGMTADRRVTTGVSWWETARDALAACSYHAAAPGLLTRWADLRAGGPRGPAALWPRRVWIEASLLLGMQGNFTGITRTVVSLIQAFLRRSEPAVGFCRYDAGRGAFVEVAREAVERRLAGNPFRPQDALDGSAPALDAHPDDVLFSPELNTSYAGEIGRLRRALACPLVTMVYDLIPYKFPHWFVGTEVGPAFRGWATATLCASDLVCAISESTRIDLRAFAEEHAIVPPPVEVIRLGDGDLADVPVPDLDQVAGVAAGEPFVLLVSTIEARKNHALAYQAWRRLIAKHGPAAVPKLLMVGSPGWMTADLVAQIRTDPVTDRHIVLVHGAADAELAWLYRNCLFALYPSHYEGWGLPVAEALAFGKACVASHTSSMPEVGGDLVDYHDPGDLVGYLAVLERMIFDGPYRAAREHRVQAGFRRTTWAECAESILGHLRRHLAGHGVDAGAERRPGRTPRVLPFPPRAVRAAA
jgi:glycosyltransferase involved in cell wall biosynthesis